MSVNMLSSNTFLMSSRDLQDIFRAGGAKLSRDGIWGSGSEKAAHRWLQTQPEPLRGTKLEQVRTNILPIARGRMVLVTRDAMNALLKGLPGDFEGLGDLGIDPLMAKAGVALIGAGLLTAAVWLGSYGRTL